jgi:hypothetical protein
MEPVVWGEIVAYVISTLAAIAQVWQIALEFMRVVFLALRVSISLQARKTLRAWNLTSGRVNICGGTRLQTVFFAFDC